MIRRLVLALRFAFVYRNAYRYVLHRLGWLAPKPYTIYKLWNGLKYKCRNDANDFDILSEVAVFREYFRYHFDRVTEDSLVLDFGGQAGSFAVYTAYTTGATVFTFEPEPENFRLLQENIALNGLERRVFAVNKAISRNDAVRTLYLSPHNNKGVHSFYHIGEQALRVECMTLAQVLDLTETRNIEFLKIDTEGEEHEIICPENGFFFERVSSMALEYHCSPIVANRQSRESLVEKIRHLGFNVKVEGTPEVGIIYAQAVRASSAKMQG